MDAPCNVIEFKNHFRPSAEYRRILCEFADTLSTLSDEFYEIALHLAINGKWRQWNESMPVGSTFTFSEDMFFGTGDEFVTEAISLRIAMSDLADKICLKITK